MQKFKELRNVLENYNSWGSTHRSALSDEGAFYLDQPEQLARVNSFIESFMGRDFVDVKNALNHLRARLNVAGLDFGIDEIKTEGKMSFPMSRHGGAFGTTPEHDLMKDGFYRDDGFGAGLNFTLESEVVLSDAGAYTVKAQIVKS